MTLIDGERDTVKVEFIPLACMWAYSVPGQEVLSWSLGASHPQVKAPVLPCPACPLENLDRRKEHLVILPIGPLKPTKLLRNSVF